MKGLSDMRVSPRPVRVAAFFVLRPAAALIAVDGNGREQMPPRDNDVGSGCGEPAESPRRCACRRYSLRHRGARRPRRLTGMSWGRVYRSDSTPSRRAPPRHCATAPCGRGSTERYRERCSAWEWSTSRTSAPRTRIRGGRRSRRTRQCAPPNAGRHCAADCAGDPGARGAHRVRSRGGTELGARVEKLSPCNTCARHDPEVAHVRACRNTPWGDRRCGQMDRIT